VKEQATVRDAQALATHYEALRKEAVQAGGQIHSMHGRALLMRHGMAAWMRSIGETVVRGALPTHTGEALRLPVSIEQHLVAIVASMAFATTQEVAA
jgi:hypothetical protein